MLALLVITFLIAAPFAALAVGSWTLARAQQAQFAEQASSYHVPAQVLKLDAPSSGAYGDPGAQARWTAHNGTVITGDITVPLGTAAWVDPAVVDHRRRPGHQSAAGGLAGHGPGVLRRGVHRLYLAVLLTITGLVTRWTLDKRRMAAWDAEWPGTGSRWTTRA